MRLPGRLRARLGDARGDCPPAVGVHCLGGSRESGKAGGGGVALSGRVSLWERGWAAKGLEGHFWGV